MLYIVTEGDIVNGRKKALKNLKNKAKSKKENKNY